MEKRHLFERELQQEALQEFDALARIKELVDWDISPALGTGLWHWRCKQTPRASVLGCAGDVPGTAVGCDAWIE